jgi:beta-carotene 3-hydroxylase
MTWLFYILVLTAAFILWKDYMAYPSLCHAWFLWYLHKDHHQVEPGFFEKNDAFFVIFAVPSILLIWFRHI